jgi:hypothetical protein
MKNFALFVTFILATLPGTVFAQTGKEAKPPAPVALENTAIYDETAYDWPGAPPTGKPRVGGVIVKPGFAASPVMAFGDCLFIDSRSPTGQPYTLPFSTAEEWNQFKAAPPDFLTLTACCPRKSVKNPCNQNSPKTITTDRVAMIRTAVFGDAYLQVFQCAPSTPSLGEWRLIGEDGWGSCPQTP